MTRSSVLGDYPPALLTYTITPPHVPCAPAPASTLQISAKNETGQPVKCSQIVFMLPVGDGSQELTTSASSVESASASDDWQIKGDHKGKFTANPLLPSQELVNGRTIGFVLADIDVNEHPGLAQIAVWETVDSQLRTGLYAVAKVPQTLAITALYAIPIEAEPVEDPEPHWSTKIYWSTTQAEEVSLSGGGETFHDLPASGSQELSLLDGTTYTLVASGEGGPIQQQLTVAVPRLKLLAFGAGANPKRTTAGDEVRLSWQAEHATAFTLDWDVNPPEPAIELKPGDSSYDVCPEVPTKYTLYADGPGGGQSLDAKVFVQPARIDRFTVEPSSIRIGESATLAWETHWTKDGRSIDPGIGPVAEQGSQSVSPPHTTDYTLIAPGYRLTAPRTASLVVVPAAVTQVEYQYVWYDPADPRYEPRYAQLDFRTDAVKVGVNGIDYGASDLAPGIPAETYLRAFAADGSAAEIEFALAQFARDGLLDVRLVAPAGLHRTNGTAEVSWSNPLEVVSVTTASGKTLTASGPRGVLAVPLEPPPPGAIHLWSGYALARLGTRIEWRVPVPSRVDQPAFTSTSPPNGSRFGTNQTPTIRWTTRGCAKCHLSVVDGSYTYFNGDVEANGEWKANIDDPITVRVTLTGYGFLPGNDPIQTVFDISFYDPF